MPFSPKKIPLHLAFWGLYLLSQGLVFMHFYEMENITVDAATGIEVVTRTVFPENFYQALRAETIELPGKLLAVYLNLFWLMPLLLFRKKTGVYLGSLLLLLAAAAAVQAVLARHVLLPFFFPKMADFSGIFTLSRAAQYVAGCGSVVVFTGAIQLVAHYFSEKNRAEELQKRQIATELQQLKAQLNPHFLFNTLNNLYGLALEKSDKTPGLLLRLSGIMSYILHDAKAPQAPLEKELAMLADFIELERLRHGERAAVSFETVGDPADWQVPPLLLLPLVENAFKHGGDAGGFLEVEIKLVLEKNDLDFSTQNNRTERPASPANSGIGLENVRRRLELLYPGRHEWRVEKLPETFFIQLKINR